MRTTLKTICAAGAATFGIVCGAMTFTPASSWSLWLAGRIGFAQAAAFPFAFAVVALGVLAAIALWRLFAPVHRKKRQSGKSKALFSRSTTICLAIWAIPSVVLAVDPNFGLQGDAHDETSAKSPARASASQADARDGAKKVDSAKNDGGAKKGGFAKNEDGANPRQTVSIVTWNAEDRGNAGDIGTLARRRDPDVIALPEYGDYREGSRTRLQNMLAKAGKNPEDYSIFESLPTGEIAPTTLVVHKRLGEYRKVDAVKTTFGSVMLRPVGDRTRPAGDRTRPLILAVHTSPPLPGLMGDWRADISRLKAFMEKTSGPAIVVGDFNATLRHIGPVTGWMDALAASGSRSGTWPSSAFSWIASPIDHIFASGRAKASDVEVIKLRRSDHKALAARVELG